MRQDFLLVPGRFCVKLSKIGAKQTCIDIRRVVVEWFISNTIRHGQLT